MSLRVTPLGTIAAFAVPRAHVPDSWEVCDGRPVNSNDARFHDLFLVIGTSWGGDGAPNFFLPDLKGMFPVVWIGNWTHRVTRLMR
jgi:microcystin-dependent protein